MVVFKKGLIVLALLTVVSTGLANAQVVNQPFGIPLCVVRSVPPLVRAEGIAELVGDIVIECIATPGSDQTLFDAITLLNITVSLNVNITNDINFGAGGDVTTAVLVVNENNCAAPASTGGILPPAAPGCDPTPGTLDDRFQIPQYGVLAANNRLEWNGVNFPFPGIDDPDVPGVPPPFPPITTLRITGIRANASQLGVPAVEGVPFSQITAFISVTGESTLSLDQNVVNVGIPLTGLLVDIDEDDAAAGLQCEDTSEHSEFTISEGFASSFKTLGVPTFSVGGLVQVENAYPAPGSGATTDPGDGNATQGGATQATRFLLRFFNIPEGVNVCVPVERNCADDDLDGIPGPADTDDDSDDLHLIAKECDEVGDACSDASTLDSGDVEDICGETEDADAIYDVVQVDIDGGFGAIVYEVQDDDPIAREDCTIPLWFGWEPDTANNLPAPGIGQLAVTFAPLSTVGTADDGEPEPRFIDTGGDPTNIIEIVKCTTTILWPFVTNQSGFDTGLVISNTSEDWLGTQPQEGTCTIHYHGATAGDGASPPDDTSSVIAAGEQLIWLLSSGNPAQEIDPTPEFQGYVIAVCEFQFGHGYAFITDGFGSVPTLAQGYLALIIDQGSNGDRIIDSGGGEALNQ